MASKNTFKLVRIDYNYCDYLRKFDYRVSYNAGLKELRPFIGILFKINNLEYFAPLSSPKPKHKNLKNILDIIKIDNGELGVINLNNMIPVLPQNYVVWDLNEKLDKPNDIRYQNLLVNQLRWLNYHYDDVNFKAYNLYIKYINNKLPSNVKDRCCNYPLLEEKCMEYNTVAQ